MFTLVNKMSHLRELEFELADKHGLNIDNVFIPNRPRVGLGESLLVDLFLSVGDARAGRNDGVMFYSLIRRSEAKHLVYWWTVKDASKRARMGLITPEEGDIERFLKPLKDLTHRRGVHTTPQGAVFGKTCRDNFCKSIVKGLPVMARHILLAKVDEDGTKHPYVDYTWLDLKTAKSIVYRKKSAKKLASRLRRKEGFVSTSKRSDTYQQYVFSINSALGSQKVIQKRRRSRKRR
jgi:hypothetical protein